MADIQDIAKRTLIPRYRVCNARPDYACILSKLLEPLLLVCHWPRGGGADRLIAAIGTGRLHAGQRRQQPCPASHPAVVMPRAHGVGDFIDPEASLQPSLSDLNRWSPMPTPNYHEMRSEACCGCTVVLGMIGGLVSLTQIYALNSTAPFSSDDPLRVCHLLTWLRCPSVAAAAAAVAAAHDQGAAAAAAGKAGITRVIHGAVRRCGGAGSEWWHIVGSIIYVEAVVALVCLGGLMWGDPGTLKRSAERCFPLPEEVRRRLMGNPSVPSGRPACPEVGSIAGMPNITESRAGRTETFCTRCMICECNF
jgi:hypothetical protein